MTNIHETAVVSKESEVGTGVQIGPYAVIGPGVTIGDGTRIMSHVVIDGNTRIGRECVLFPFSSIGLQTQDLKYKGKKTYVEIGDNTTLREYVTVNSGTNEGEITKVGSDCHIMAYCHIAHACNVGNNVIMSNCATLAGDVIVEDGAIIGGLSGVHQFTRIGSLCFIGGMTKITQDCPPFMMVDGNPAAVKGINSVGMKRNNVSESAQKSLKEAYKILYRQKLSTRQALDKIRAEVAGCNELERLTAFIESSERGIVK